MSQNNPCVAIIGLGFDRIKPDFNREAVSSMLNVFAARLYIFDRCIRLVQIQGSNNFLCVVFNFHRCPSKYFFAKNPWLSFSLKRQREVLCNRAKLAYRE